MLFATIQSKVVFHIFYRFPKIWNKRFQVITLAAVLAFLFYLRVCLLISLEFIEAQAEGEDSLLRRALRPRQIGGGWSGAFHSAVKVSYVITLGAKGGHLFLPSPAAHDLDICQIPNYFAFRTVQEKIETPHIFQPQALNTDTDAHV